MANDSGIPGGECLPESQHLHTGDEWWREQLDVNADSTGGGVVFNTGMVMLWVVRLGLNLRLTKRLRTELCTNFVVGTICIIVNVKVIEQGGIDRRLRRTCNRHRPAGMRDAVKETEKLREQQCHRQQHCPHHTSHHLRIIAWASGDQGCGNGDGHSGLRVPTE